MPGTSSYSPRQHTRLRAPLYGVERVFLLLNFFFIFGITFSQSKKKEIPVKYWEELHDTARTNIKTSAWVNKNAVLCLDGKIIPSDDSLTRRMLFDITMPTERGLSMNFFVFNQIVKQHEKALDPMMGEFCRRMILSHPDYTLIWLYGQHEKKNALWKSYARYVGEQCTPMEYQNMENFLAFYFGSGGKAAARQMSAMFLKESKKYRK